MSNDENNELNNEVEEPDSVELLIEAVRTRPVLFTLTHVEYKNQGKKELIWNQISEEINQTISWCKSKWKYLRDHYKIKKKALKGKSGDAAKRIKAWTYFQMLTFLDGTIEDSEIATFGNVLCDDNSQDGMNETENAATVTDDLSLKTPVKKRKSDTNDAVDEALIQYLSSQSNNEKDQKDSHYYFAMDIAEHLRRLPPDAAAFIKMKVHSALYEVEQKLKSCSSTPDVNQ